jgi:protein-disulfide isomerase
VSRKTIWIALGIVILLAAGVAAWLLMKPNQDLTGTTTASGPGFTIVSTDRTLGNPKAKVTLIEYAAPSCPVCAAFNAQSFATLKAKYIDSGKVFYVFRVFPLRADDGTAEKIARCLPEDKYFSFIDLLFRNQPKWDVEYGVTDVHAGLVLMGRIAGMSADQVDKCIDNKTEDDRINKVAADGESKYNISGTPTFVVDGNAQPAGNDYDGLSKVLDAELAK